MRDRILDVTTSLAVRGSLVIIILFRDQSDIGWVIRGAGLLVAAGGVSLLVAGALGLRHAMTSSFTPKALVTTGVYSRIRHPIYLGGSLFLVGLGVCLQSIVGLYATALLAIPAYWWSALEEERRLRAVFGEDYDAYRTRTWM